MAFLKTTDYDVQIRSEISNIIDSTQEKSKLLLAEKMAIAQIKNHLSGRYDMEAVFTPAPETGEDPRDQYIVMLTIDIALYHLWSKEAASRIPKHRELRYNDALEWLKSVQKGLSADLPEIVNGNGETETDIRIWSIREPEDNIF
jgi:phage gp36-like protein